MADGKLTVRLHGTRYRGAEYHLFRTRDRDWLVILKGKVSLPQPAPPPTYEPMMAVLTASRSTTTSGCSRSSGTATAAWPTWAPRPG